MDNLSGDLETLKGSIETGLIKSGSTANDVLRGMTQAVTGAVDAYSDLPEPIQGAVTAIAGIGGVVSVASGAFLLGAPKIAAFKQSLSSMGPIGQRAGNGLLSVGRLLTGPWGFALAGAVGVLGVWAKKNFESKRRVEELAGSLDDQTGAITENTRAIAANNLEKDGLIKVGNKAGVDSKTLVDAYLGEADAIQQVNDALDGRTAKLGSGGIGGGSVSSDAAKFTRLRDAIKGGNSEMSAAQEKAKRLRDAVGETGTAADGTSQSVDGLTQEIADGKSAADEAADAVSAYKDQLDQLNGVNITAAQQQIALEKSFNDATDAIDKSRKVTLDEKSALLDVADQANQTAAAILEQTGSQEKANRVLVTSRDRFITLAQKMGYTKAEAKKLADQFLQMPPARATSITTPGMTTARQAAADYKAKLAAIKSGVKTKIEQQGMSTSASAVDHYLTKLGNIPRSVTTKVQVVGDKKYIPSGTGGKALLADGGFVRGPGGPRDESL